MFGVCCATKYTHSSLLAGSHCTVALFRGIVPRIKIHHSGRAICGASKLFDNSEQVFEPCRIVLKELKMRSSSHYNVSTKKRRHNKTLKLFFFLCGCHLFVDLRISRGPWNPNLREKRGLSVLYYQQVLWSQINI